MEDEKFKVKSANITRKDGMVILERTFVETMTEEEFNKFEKETKLNYVAHQNNIKRYKAQIEASPIIEDNEIAKLSDMHKKAIEAANILYNIDQVKMKLEAEENAQKIAKAYNDALDLIAKNEGN